MNEAIRKKIGSDTLTDLSEKNHSFRKFFIEIIDYVSVLQHEDEHGNRKSRSRRLTSTLIADQPHFNCIFENVIKRGNGRTRNFVELSSCFLKTVNAPFQCVLHFNASI